jgi:hypothetical protein
MVTYVAIFSTTIVRAPEMSALLGKASTSGELAKVQSLRREPHEPTGSCLVHGAEICLSSDTLTY